MVILQRKSQEENRMPNITAQKMQVKTTKCYEQLGQESGETVGTKEAPRAINIQCNHLLEWSKTMPKRKGTALKEEKRRLVSNEPQFLLSK